MEHAARRRHRAVLVLSGGRAWTASTALALAKSIDSELCGFEALWLSDRPELSEGAANARPIRAATRTIGSETALLCYDAWSGLDPDALAAACGTLRGGGLLLLLTPPLGQWPDLPDPQAQRIASWPHGPEGVGPRFPRRIARALADQPAVTLVRQGEPLPPPPEPLEDTREPTPPSLPSNPAGPATADQSHAIEAVIRTARGRARRPLLLVADRGRGKSAALGIAAARLLAAGASRVLVTAPRREACESLFRHAALGWPGEAGAFRGPSNELSRGDRSLCFLPPDLLCASTVEHRSVARCDLLLVDEAAAIPVPLLTCLLRRFGRVVFATTVHGYEGTGRGFDLRFRAVLDRLTPAWRRQTLEQPIRWATGDPLEALLARVLLLEATPAVPPDPLPPRPRVSRLAREALASDDAALSQVFGLLVLAHYQTRPMDLRMLLDAPGVRLYAVSARGRILATLVAIEEGGISDPGLRQEVFEGRRRPRGHLIPQTLSAHGGLADAPALRFLRVVRIAVHPALERQGLGGRLVRILLRDARREGLDLIGASFGAAPELIAFWRACGLRPVHLGTSRNAASGEHALVMLRAGSARGRRFVGEATGRLARRLPTLLPGPLRDLEPHLVAALAQAIGRPLGIGRYGAGGEETQELRSFTRGHRGLEAVLPGLAELVRHHLGPALGAGVLSPRDAALLCAAALQLEPPARLSARFEVSGQSELLAELRRAAASLADQVAVGH